MKWLQAFHSAVQTDLYSESKGLDARISSSRDSDSKLFAKAGASEEANPHC